MNPEFTLVSSPPVIATLISGIIIAFALQLLLTSFGVATGVTVLGYLPSNQTENSESEDSESETDQTESSQTGISFGTIGFAVGAGTLLTINTVLFAACWLAVKLSLVNDPILGAILGFIIWSGYFLIVVWISSRAAGSVLGAIVGTMTAGVRGFISTLRKTLIPPRAATLPKAVQNQLDATEATLNTIQKRLDATPDENNIESTIQNYLASLQPPELNVEAIRSEVAKILATPELLSLKQVLPIHQFDRQSFLQLVSDRTDLSKRDVSEVVDALDLTWHEVLGEPDKTTDLINFFSSANPDQLTADEISERIQQLQLNRSQNQTDAVEPPTVEQSVGFAQLQQVDLKQLGKRLLRTVLQRVDLSDVDVGRILPQLQSLINPLQSSDRASDSFSPIKADVEDYLLNTYVWSLTRKTVKIEFKDVIYDSEANPVAVREQLLRLNQAHFVSLLEQRDDLTSAQIKKIARRLEEVRQEVLDTLQTAEVEAQSQAFMAQVASYLKAAPAVIEPATLQRQLRSFLQETELTINSWSDRLQQLNPAALASLLQERQDMSQAQLKQLIEQIETARNLLLAEVKDLQAHIRQEADSLWSKLEVYVRDHDQKLTARNIQRQFKVLLKEANVEPNILQAYLPTFERKTVENWLSDRSDLSDKQRRRAIEQLEKAWNSLIKAAETASTNVQATSDRAFAVLKNYLQQTDWSTVKLADLPQDLLSYLQKHQLELAALGQLAASDWGLLLEQFNQQIDLPEAQRQQLVSQLQRAIYTLGKFPRRFALRAKANAQTVQETLVEYLKQVDREDLNGEQLQQLIAHLLNNLPAKLTSPLQTWRSFPLFEREQLVALLSERGDLTAAEVEHLVETVETTVQQAADQLQVLQQQVQQVTSSTFVKLRDYFTSLELPRLDDDRIKQELQQLLINPQIGIDALAGSLGETLRDRLSALNHESLTALLKARDDISESFSHQLVDRVDAVRLNILNQIESLQLQTKQRLDDLKQQAQQRAETTRKVIATAAWWLFSTALTSAISSTIAGAIAVSGLSWMPF